MAVVFQDARVHTNPVRSIGDFMIEALVTNGAVPASEARRRAAGLLDQVGIADAEGGYASSRTSSPAACCSA